MTLKRGNIALKQLQESVSGGLLDRAGAGARARARARARGWDEWKLTPEESLFISNVSGLDPPAQLTSGASNQQKNRLPLIFFLVTQLEATKFLYCIYYNPCDSRYVYPFSKGGLRPR
ncbi:hypothetical protein EMCG_04374 [[Emmonsia] crescens]|uniref:Uncharacterized protein n=1 Tax=[Emmonsia] crescens TaxID=73230 RepID=A0A0G2J7H6_9EURO|nr:hypothetical protein EMCG_04374 [Emmonsia crescens UAMH 3008]